jgi:hypothetical protein
VGYDGMWMPGKPKVCTLCVQKHLLNSVRAKEKERRKAREAVRNVEKEKLSDAIAIHKNTNPFNYNQMQKVLKENSLNEYLKVHINKINKKTKYKYKK